MKCNCGENAFYIKKTYSENECVITSEVYKCGRNIDNTKKYNRLPESSIFEMSHNLLFHLGISTLLRYEDRNSMAHGVESRLPFLDYRLVEYCLNMSDHLKLSKGVTKKILRDSMKDIVPDKILNRHDKMGFLTPQNQWMDADKKKYLNLENESLQYMSFINKQEIKPIIEKDNNLLWRVINAGRWIKIFDINA